MPKRAAQKPPAVQDESEQLVVSIDRLTGELHILRQVLDEIREEFSWITRNGVPVRQIDHVHVTRMAIDPLAEERIAIVSRHLFAAKSGGVFIPLDRLDERALLAAYKETRKQKVVEIADEEGIVREALAP